MDSLEGFRDALIASGVGREAAERFARAKFGQTTHVAVASADDLAGELEDVHVTEGDRLMRSLGFEVVSFSQKKRAKVTPGIPDRKYYHRGRRLTLWWEAKADWGRRSPAQRQFHEMAEACGEIVVCGPLENLKTWLVDAGVATRAGDLFEPTSIAA